MNYVTASSDMHVSSGRPHNSTATCIATDINQHYSSPVTRHLQHQQTLLKAVLAPVEETIKILPDASMKEQAQMVVARFQGAAAKHDMSYAPRLSATLADDGSLLIEWTFPDRRMGFNIEPKQDESGWYLVSSKSAGGHSAAGFLSELDADQMLSQILRYEPLNSLNTACAV